METQAAPELSALISSQETSEKVLTEGFLPVPCTHTSQSNSRVTCNSLLAHDNPCRKLPLLGLSKLLCRSNREINSLPCLIRKRRFGSAQASPMAGEDSSWSEAQPQAGAIPSPRHSGSSCQSQGCALLLLPGTDGALWGSRKPPFPCLPSLAPVN